MSSLHLALALITTRRSRRLRQNELARTAGIDASYLAALETGKRRSPSRRLVERICAALGTTPEEERAIRKLAAIGELLEKLRGHQDVPELQEIERLVSQLSTMTFAELKFLADVAQLILSRNTRGGGAMTG